MVQILSKQRFRTLKHHRKLRTCATVTLRDADGLRSTAGKRITLKAPAG